MAIRLGEGIDWSAPVPEPAPPAPGPSVEERAAELFANSVSQLREALALMPPPVVQTENVDLGEIVTAIQGLKGSATAEEIAEAIARKIAPQNASNDSDVVAAIKEMAELFDYRMKGVGAAFGASGPSNIASDPNRQIGIVSGTVELGEASLAAIETLTPEVLSVTAPGTLSIPAVAASVLAARTGRRTLLIQNTSIVAVYLGFGGNPTTTTGIRLNTGEAFSLDNYPGSVHAVAASAVSIPYIEVYR